MGNATEPESDDVPSSATGKASIQDRISAFEMLDAMPEHVTIAQKCMRLSVCGFNNHEIAAMMRITAGGVSQNLYMERQKSRPKAAKKFSKKP